MSRSPWTGESEVHAVCRFAALDFEFVILEPLYTLLGACGVNAVSASTAILSSNNKS